MDPRTGPEAEGCPCASTELVSGCVSQSKKAFHVNLPLCQASLPVLTLWEYFIFNATHGIEGILSEDCSPCLLLHPISSFTSQTTQFWLPYSGHDSEFTIKNLKTSEQRGQHQSLQVLRKVWYFFKNTAHRTAQPCWRSGSLVVTPGESKAMWRGQLELVYLRVIALTHWRGLNRVLVWAWPPFGYAL